MTVTQTLRSRVSIRAYTDKVPSSGTLRQILDAARWSPAGRETRFATSRAAH
jgi:nitroreductase